MAAVPPEPGLDFHLPWGVVEWVLGGIVSAGVAVAAWVWRLGGKVEQLQEKIGHLEEQNKMLEGMVVELKGDHRQTQQLVRSFANALDKKIGDQTERIETRIDGLSSRIDRLIESKLSGRAD